MTKTVYVFRDGELVEKKPPAPKLIWPLPFDPPRPFDRENFRALYEGGFQVNPLEQVDKPITPSTIDHFREALAKEWEHYTLRPRGTR